MEKSKFQFSNPVLTHLEFELNENFIKDDNFEMKINISSGYRTIQRDGSTVRNSACVTAKCKLLCCKEVGRGGTNSTGISIRKVVETAMGVNASTESSTSAPGTRRILGSMSKTKTGTPAPTRPWTPKAPKPSLRSWTPMSGPFPTSPSPSTRAEPKKDRI